MKKIFDTKKYKFGISWWEKVLLFFKPVKIASDIGRDADCYIYYKVLFGKMYVIDTKYELASQKPI